MLRSLTGQIAAYLEFYEFMDDRVLMGVPDFVPREVVDGRSPSCRRGSAISARAC